ncbi:hypothetical protein CCGE531_18910 [Rhizobium sp. CCGE531]|nr:hypothetical protein CCGE531_18910 [Rhizobium sp. CCGE531]AYG74258.1 hypothetical protein CCGE532_18405 [Rhizobium sp. CCGE532]
MEASSENERVYEAKLSKLCAGVKLQEFPAYRFHEAVIASWKSDQGKGLAASHKAIVTKLLLRLHSGMEEFPYNQTGPGD